MKTGNQNNLERTATQVLSCQSLAPRLVMNELTLSVDSVISRVQRRLACVWKMIAVDPCPTGFIVLGIEERMRVGKASKP